MGSGRSGPAGPAPELATDVRRGPVGPNGMLTGPSGGATALRLPAGVGLTAGDEGLHDLRVELHGTVRFLCWLVMAG
jgi:hypothetical protein